ncbi:ER membrane protein DP1/Yop1, partial [Cladochytrium tenue]
TYFALGAGTILFVLVFFNVWGDFLTDILGFAWPAYQSFKAIESVDKNDDRQWLTYWTVFGFLNLIEFFSNIILYWIPFYYTFKAALILYLILPQTRGAIVIYNQVVRPYLLKEQAIIDSGLNKVKAKAGAAISEISAELSKQE